MRQGGDHEIAVARQPLRKQAQNHALAGARLPDDQGEAAVADQMLVDAPAEAFDARRDEQRFGRQFGREGIPLEAVKREQSTFHRPSLLGRKAGGRPDMAASSRICLSSGAISPAVGVGSVSTGRTCRRSLSALALLSSG